MTTRQHPLGSGFGYRSTTTDVLCGSDLTGRTAVVTGGYSGLGLETTRVLSAAGAHVIVPARRPDTARDQLARMPNTSIEPMNLADLASVGAFARTLLDRGESVDILIAAGGVMATPKSRAGSGWESQFAINHLGHFALVNQLWPALSSGGARVVCYSSAGHHLSGIRWDDIHFDTGYDKWLAYGQSKTANALFAVHLDTLGHQSGVRAFSLHPGSILTPLQRHMSHDELASRGWVDAAGNPADPTFKTPAQGAATGVWAATSPQLTGMGGLYCEDCDIAAPANPNGSMEVGGVRDHATDPDQAARLWHLSADLAGLNAFAAP